MEKLFKTYIKSQNLFEKKDKILVAISGGCDSVALSYLLKKMNFKFSLAHCNFNLRGKDSDKDEQFVKNIASKQNLKIYIESFDTISFAKQNNYSIEEAARILRYKWFEELRRKYSYDYIATAHHLNDRIETFFINIIAGTGIKGIRSIKAKNNKIVRPLLFAKRTDIEKWCILNKIEFRTDKSNSDIKFIRNKIRHEIFPRYKEINPAFERTMAKNFDVFSDIEKIYNQYIEDSFKSIVSKRKDLIYINIQLLMNEVAPKTVLFEIINKFGYNASQSDSIFKNIDLIQTGKVFHSKNYRLIKDRKNLILKKNIKKYDNIFYVYENHEKIQNPISLSFKILSMSDNFENLKDKDVAYFDADKVVFPIVIRTKRDADIFYPFGMKGKKLVSNYFTDIKLNLFEKEETFLLISNKEIMWIIGYRTDDRYKITGETKRVLIVKLLK